MLNLLRVIATSAVKAIKSPLAAVARPTVSPIPSSPPPS